MEKIYQRLQYIFVSVAIIVLTYALVVAYDVVKTLYI
jgi:hypothetical protein